jgi:hypothetical protein
LDELQLGGDRGPRRGWERSLIHVIYDFWRSNIDLRVSENNTNHDAKGLIGKHSLKKRKGTQAREEEGRAKLGHYPGGRTKIK